MKRTRDPAVPAASGRGSASAALQLTLPLFDGMPTSRPAGALPDGRPHIPTPPRLPGLAPSGAKPLRPPAAPPRTPAPSARARRVTCLAGQPIEYELRRSQRRTIGFHVDDTGLRVTAPRWVSLAEIESALIEKSRWILRKLVEWRDHAHRRERLAVRWEAGEQVSYLGRSLTLQVRMGASTQVVHEAQSLRVSLPAGTRGEALREAVQGWLQQRARDVFAQRLPIFCERLGRAPTRWGLSSARTRWGSCALDGSIRLNWRLIHFPIEVVDYVIAHELAHLCEMNHGPRFWATVATLLPGFEASRRLLRDFPDDLPLS
jgi:predicted metal-dependent hydrolase